jgi:hypothetical protein
MEVGENVRRDKRTVEERSPTVEVEPRNVRQRLTEFDIGEIFSGVEKAMRGGVETAMSQLPDQVKGPVGKGFGCNMTAMVEMMNALSDTIQAERRTHEDTFKKVEVEVSRAQEKLAEVSNVTKSLARSGNKIKVRESVAEMEKKVSEAQCGIKLMNVDIGRATEDRREIVRRTIEVTRSWVGDGDVRHYDRVMKRTRVIILGKGTSRRDSSSTEYTVPTLFQCRDRRDAEDLELILRSAGYFPSFHWPKEILDFIHGIKEEVRKQGVDERANYFRVRPEAREGRLLIKVEVKAKEHGTRFALKGLWACPPLSRALWEEVQDLYRPWQYTRS